MLWGNVRPDGSAKRDQGIDGVEVFGDREAVDFILELMKDMNAKEWLTPRGAWGPHGRARIRIVWPWCCPTRVARVDQTIR